MTDTAARSCTLCIGILTLNEERRIAQCIRSASFADQIIVVDSGSADATCDIARSAGAEVHTYNDWQGFAVQRNRVLAHCHTDFIFFLDADEEISPDLRAEIRAAVSQGQDVVWEVLWNEVAFGRALTRMKRSGGAQRLFPTASIDAFEGVVHEKAAMQGGPRPVRKFRTRLLHHSRETIHGSLLKLAQYAQLGAVKRARAGSSGGILRGFASASANFIKLYFFQRGFLCGPQGFLFCLFIAMECFFRYVALEYDSDGLETTVKR